VLTDAVSIFLNPVEEDQDCREMEHVCNESEDVHIYSFDFTLF